MVRLTAEFFPVVIFQPLGDCGPPDVDESEKAYRELFRRREKFISLSDARRSANHASQRRLWADLTQRLEGPSTQWTVTTIIVLDSAALRAALTAVNWIVKPLIPQVVVKTPEEACVVARELAETHDLSLPADFTDEILRWIADGVSLYESAR
jgi:hypothetical protein